MSADYIAASYGGIDILVSQLETTGGRDIVVQSPSRGDRHVLQDRGLKVKSTHCTVLFVDQPGKAHYLVRFDAFRTASEETEASVFSHPILGTFAARITEFSFSANEEQAVTVNCTIIAEEEPQVVFRTAAGVSLGPGVAAVGAAAGVATATLAELGLTLEPDVAGAAVTTATAWDEAQDLDAQQVLLETATLTNQIDDAIDELELTTDLERWPAYQAMILLRFQLSRAAEVAMSDAEHVFDLYVGEPRPLLAICAEVYGPDLAIERRGQIAKLNRVRNPGRVESGTTLKMLSDGAR